MRWTNKIQGVGTFPKISNGACVPVQMEWVEKPSIIMASEIMSNDLNEEVTGVCNHILQQRERIPAFYIYNAINIVQKFYRNINTIQIISCIFDDEDQSMFDVELKKGETLLNVTVTIGEDDNSNIIGKAYVLHNRKLNYGSIDNIIHLIQSL